MRPLIVGLAAALKGAGTAVAECVDINADPIESLVTIVHIDEERAGQIVAQLRFVRRAAHLRLPTIPQSVKTALRCNHSSGAGHS